MAGPLRQKGLPGVRKRRRNLADTSMGEVRRQLRYVVGRWRSRNSSTRFWGGRVQFVQGGHPAEQGQSPTPETDGSRQTVASPPQGGPANHDWDELPQPLLAGITSNCAWLAGGTPARPYPLAVSGHGTNPRAQPGLSCSPVVGLAPARATLSGPPVASRRPGNARRGAVPGPG